jgi:hypothetical protein
VQKSVGPEGGHPIEAAHSEAGGELDEAAEYCTDEDEVLELLCELESQRVGRELVAEKPNCKSEK